MTGPRESIALRALRAAGIAAFLVAVALPMLVVAAGAFASPSVFAAALTPRRLGLLLSSVRFAAAVGLADVAIGVLAAAWVVLRPGRAVRVVPLVLLGLALPALAHVAAFGGAADALPAALAGWRPAPAVAAWAVQTLVLAPVAFLVCIGGLRAVDPASLDSARVSGGDRRALTRVAAPLAAPAFLAAFGLTFALALGEHAVASSFSYDVYSMELYAEYSASGSAGATFALAWPLIVIAAGVAAACAAQVRALVTRSPRGRAFEAPGHTGALALPLVAAVAVAAGWPLLVIGSLLAQAAPLTRMVTAVRDAAPELTTTALVCFAAGVVSAVVALASEASLHPRAPRVWAWAVALAAVAVPAPVIGAGLVAAYDHGATASIYDGPAVLVLASIARFLPLAVLAVGAAASRVDARAADAASLAAPPVRAFAGAVLPRLVPAAVAGGLAVAALASGEISATLMVVPAGSGTLATRMYNLLHYGASGEVAALALAVCALAVGAATAAWSVARSGARRGRAVA